MKKIFLIVFLVAVIAGGAFWHEKHKAAEGAAKPAAEKAAADKPDADDAAGTKVSRDDKGNVVITMDDDTQGDNGINVAKVEAVQLDAEIKGYGHVLDPAPLAALLTELASTQAAYAATSNELARLNTLAAQGNTSARAVQTGEAAARRDQLAVESAKDRLALGWEKPLRNKLIPLVSSSL